MYQVRLLVNLDRTIFGAKDSAAVDLYAAQLRQQYLAGGFSLRGEADFASVAALALLTQVGRCPTDSSEANLTIMRTLSKVAPPQSARLYDASKTAGDEDLSRGGLYSDGSTRGVGVGGSLSSDPLQPQLRHEQLERLNAFNQQRSQRQRLASWGLNASDDGVEGDSSTLSFNSPAPQSSLAFKVDDASEASSKTWRLTSPQTLETYKGGDKDVCDEIRSAWRRLDVGLSSISEAQAAFISKLTSSVAFKPHQFVAYVSVDSPAARSWVAATLKPSGRRLRSWLRRATSRRDEELASSRSAAKSSVLFSSICCVDPIVELYHYPESEVALNIPDVVERLKPTKLRRDGVEVFQATRSCSELDDAKKESFLNSIPQRETLLSLVLQVRDDGLEVALDVGDPLNAAIVDALLKAAISSEEYELYDERRSSIDQRSTSLRTLAIGSTDLRSDLLLCEKNSQETIETTAALDEPTHEGARSPRFTFSDEYDSIILLNIEYCDVLSWAYCENKFCVERDASEVDGTPRSFVEEWHTPHGKVINSLVSQYYSFYYKIRSPSRFIAASSSYA